MTNLAPVAPDAPVFGVCRPGHLGADVAEWSALLEDAGVSRVICLLSEAEAGQYGLPEAYADRFAVEHVPIRDRHLPEPAMLDRAIDLLEEANYAGERVAIHCNAGLGRTGLVAAAWLTRAHGYEPEGAVEAVEAAGRAPREAVRDGNATETELLALLAGEQGPPGANPE